MTRVAHATRTAAGAQSNADEWVSVHIPVACAVYTAAYDERLRALAVPVINRCVGAGIASKAFFVRYSDGGPHIRLRVLPTAGRATAVRSVIESVCERGTPSGGLPIQWSVYVPETARYGGSCALAASETLFHASSQVSLAMLDGVIAADRSARTGRALGLSLAMCQAWFGDVAAIARFARRYSQSVLSGQLGYLPGDRQLLARGKIERAADVAAGASATLVRALWDELAAGRAMSGPVERFRVALRQFRSAIEGLAEGGSIPPSVHPMPRSTAATLGDLVGSHIHMTNNRIGISPIEECYIMATLHRALRA